MRQCFGLPAHNGDSTIMKTLFAAAVLALSFAAPAVHARATPAAPDPLAMKAATEMLDAMNQRAMTLAAFAQMRQVMPVMMKQTATAAINNDPQLDATQKLAKINQLDSEVQQRSSSIDSLFDDPTLMNEIMQNTAVLWARHYTVAEMRQIAAFYKSPVGMKMLASTPQMMSESMQMTQSLVMPRIDAMMKKMIAERPAK
jgi:uncharacterized protein